MKLVPYRGVLVKENVGEILKSFDKFQVVPSSMRVFTTNLNRPLAPLAPAMVSVVSAKCDLGSTFVIAT